MPELPGWFGKFWRYGLTAGTAAVVDLGGFAMFHALGLPLPAAAASSFVVAAVVNYVLTSRFVFAARSAWRMFIRFLTAALIGLAINVGVTVLAATQFAVPEVLAKMLGIGIAFCFNFALNLLFVFVRPKR